ncbi:hypothetical protein KYY02_12315 [Streptomyces pimonensis]|uniref:Uncharacterized protein n=1 Tax=Streptomyces pimonensis TaxID=2860288 RepID=A0ABV4IXS0_9ACTN
MDGMLGTAHGDHDLIVFLEGVASPPRTLLRTIRGGWEWRDGEAHDLGTA